jgi:hypothetical protein
VLLCGAASKLPGIFPLGYKCWLGHFFAGNRRAFALNYSAKPGQVSLGAEALERKVSDEFLIVDRVTLLVRTQKICFR